MNIKERKDLLTKYMESNPYTEAIYEKESCLVVIDRYGANDYGAWWTNEEHLYDDSYGDSVRGTLQDILSELKGCN